MEWTKLAAILVGFGLLVVIPVVAILTEHQRKMARILHGMKENEELPESDPVTKAIALRISGSATSSDTVLDEIRALRNEVADLRLQVANLQSTGSQPPIDEVRRVLSENA